MMCTLMIHTLPFIRNINNRDIHIMHTKPTLTSNRCDGAVFGTGIAQTLHLMRITKHEVNTPGTGKRRRTTRSAVLWNSAKELKNI